VTIPTEPIGNIPRPPRLLAALARTDGADPLYDEAVRDTSTNRDTAFAEVRARVAGTALAAKLLGGG
jgi:hypothetical protein